MKTLRYAAEAALLYLLFAFFRILPAKMASSAGGWIGRSIGPHLAVNRKARRHIQSAFPGITEDKEHKITQDMWDNLGRVIAEYPHLQTLSARHTDIDDRANIQQYFDQGQAVIFIGGHIGNWEINSAATLTHYDQKINLTYRKPNNPWTAWLLEYARTLGGQLQAFPKSHESGRHLIRVLRNNESVGILVDQKYNEGIESHFFGMPAMTNPVFVQLAQKFKCPVIPVRNERLHGCHSRLTTYPPLTLFDEQGAPLPVKDVISEANALLEAWITERPGQWIWLHRRWKN